MHRRSVQKTSGSRLPSPAATAKFFTAMMAVSVLVNAALLIGRPPHGGRSSIAEFLLGLMNFPVERGLLALVTSLVMFWALLRRKRAAWWALVAFQAIDILMVLAVSVAIPLQEMPVEIWPEHIMTSVVFDYVSGAVAVLFLVLLLRARSEFPARIHASSYGKALLALLLGALVTLYLAWLLVPGDGLRTMTALLMNALGIYEPTFTATLGRVAHWKSTVINTVMALTMVVSLWLFLRSSRASHVWDAEKALQVRQLLHEYGGNDSLSYFATRRDKSVLFSEDGRAAVAYKVIGSVSLASGDPVGAPASWPGAIEAWKAEARTYGWIPAVISASEAGARAYVQAGLSLTAMGDEAILRPDRFSLNNTSMTEVRNSAHRVAKAGVTLSVRRHDELTREQLQDMVRLTDSWRHGDTERGFSMALNRLGDPADGRCVLVTAHDAAGTPVGLLSFVPWGSSGLSLDIMRRSPEAPNGTTEFMIAQLMEQCEGLGITQVSLNFAMFRQTFARAEEFGASALTRMSSSILGGLDRYLQLERLYQFNQKFQPTWVPRYLCMDSRISLISVALAAGVAEGFLPEWLGPSVRGGGDYTPEQLERLREIERFRPVEASDLTPRWSDQTRHRIQHLEQMRAAGHEPYPKGTGEGITVQQAAPLLEQGVSGAGAAGTELAVNGRVRSIRDHGGVVFLDLLEHGVQIQAVLEAKDLGPGNRERVRWLDTGDHVLLRGRPGASRTGTPSLLVQSWELTSKCLHPIPFDSFTDPEARLRHRSVDLVVNPEESRRLQVRSRTIRSIRRTLDETGFLEVETPMLNTVHGGASARPFKTFINAYGVDLTLRIAPELYLKRLVVGDMGPVYELGRDFRNEGADNTHNPEFTVLEAYQPYADYRTMRELTERLLKNAAREVFGEVCLPLRFGESPKDPRTPTRMTDVSAPWRVISVCEALSQVVGQPISLDTDFETLLGLARTHEIHVRDDMGPGAVIEELYGELVEAKTSMPTFYTDFPVETSPLAGPHRSQPGLAERWDLVINGTEMGTAYSEMADALEQRRRLTEQSLKAAAGDLEAMQVDEDFLHALENGMPPTGGLGIGIDRLIMMLTDAPIRGVLAFPFVRPTGR